jgi:hypothetical protein
MTTHNAMNAIVDNVLSNEEIAQVYEALKTPSGNNFVKVHCQYNTFIQLPQNVVDKFVAAARKASGNDNLVMTEYCHAKYNNRKSDDGRVDYRPSLFPHYDETFKEPRFTFDYQLDANIKWPIIVEDRDLVLDNNQAATFSGTHQIHWREATKFEDEEYVEMIFCHLTDPNLPEKGPDLNKEMDKKASHYQEIYYSNGGWSNG